MTALFLDLMLALTVAGALAAAALAVVGVTLVVLLAVRRLLT